MDISGGFCIEGLQNLVCNVKVNRIKEEKFDFDIEPTKIGKILAK